MPNLVPYRKQQANMIPYPRLQTWKIYPIGRHVPIFIWASTPRGSTLQVVTHIYIEYHIFRYLVFDDIFAMKSTAETNLK